jgi:tryptophan-rich sensory protein
MIEQWPVLAAFVAANIAAAMTGGFFRPGAWYASLSKPSWNPPNWLFAPAWTVLYAMIAYAGYVFWLSAPPEARALPIAIYAVQLLLNAGWSALFFGAKRMDLALIDAILMWIAILATIVAFYPYAPTASFLLVPYLLWVAFATALNYSLLRRNASRHPPADPQLAERRR